jgi:hypothetical protein
MSVADFYRRLEPVQRRSLISLIATFMGALLGIFFIYPINEFIFLVEYGAGLSSYPVTLKAHMAGELRNVLTFQTPFKTLFYAAIGAFIGLVSALVYHTLQARIAQIHALTAQLGRDVEALITQGEGPGLEFKSSFRWDIDQQRVNRGLETVVLKTLAGLMNGDGGTLLIGVADDGRILGLERDIAALRRRDLDGFEQALISSVAAHLGADLCPHIQIVFHRLGEHDICRVIATPSPRPVFLHEGKQPAFYLRTGGGTRPLDIREATEHISRRWERR